MSPRVKKNHKKQPSKKKPKPKQITPKTNQNFYIGIILNYIFMLLECLEKIFACQ